MIKHIIEGLEAHQCLRDEYGNVYVMASDGVLWTCLFTKQARDYAALSGRNLVELNRQARTRFITIGFLPAELLPPGTVLTCMNPSEFSAASLDQLEADLGLEITHVQ